MVQVTSSTANSSGVGPFDTRFQTGAAVLSGVFFLVALAIGWLGYDGAELLGTELNVVSGAAGLMVLSFFGVISLVVATYMEPGFDH
ncbi:hypothetical protein SAMN04487967_1494 [Natronorubrum sediminis]|uniref:Uncharacterized protein n=1 Tax=Natronorubrum sediminis TaxID=640943 RepID=A0A1H6FTR6_9EURY|nr:hypothetical protein SAMN04487967_1494 [Natronorubrum sediminis]